MTAFDALEARVWPVRLLRVWAASLTGLFLALAGHVLGGGTSSLPIILTVLALVASAAWSLSRRRLTTGQIVGLLLIAQVVVHLGCMIGTPASTMGPAMIAGHLTATAITAVLLSRGETFLWALVERLGLRIIPLLSAVVLPVRSGSARIPAYDEPRPPVFTLVGGTGLRGPPIGAF